VAKTIAGPGRLGSAKAVKKSLKGGGQKNVKTISAEDSLTVRFLDEPEDWHGYYEHFMSNGPLPCTTDECDGCDSDDPDEKKRSFKYLANAYVVDDQKVWALKMPKSLVEILMAFHTKYKGTLLDRDYELSRTGSGQYDTKYMAAPEDRQKMNLSRFDKKKFDLGKLLSDMVNGEDDDDDDDDDEPVSRKKSSKSVPKKSKGNPWNDDEDDDDDDEPVRRKVPKKKSSASGPAKKKSAAKHPVKKTVKRSR
jgi:hypothetical protein